MNKLKLLLALFLGVILFIGCQTWEEPEFKADDWVAPKDWVEWTIGSKGPNDRRNVLGIHKDKYGQAPDSIVSYKARTSYLRAVVVSSDEGGNFYKSLTIQDATGAVQLQLDQTGLFNFYPVGQKIVLVLNGLVIGDYNQLPQIGWIYNGNQVGRINSLFIDKYIIRDGKPSLQNIPKPLTNDEIDFFENSDVNKLVRLEGVKFEQEAIGKPLSFDFAPTDWKVFVPLSNGNSQVVMVRTSDFAKFRNVIIEDKEYNLTGILTKFRDTYQFMIRTKDDIQVLPSGETVAFDFATNPLGDGKWSNYTRLGTNTQWGFRTAGFMLHAGNSAGDYHVAMDDWLISPLITFSDVENGYLQIEHELPVLNAQYDAYQVYYTTTNSTTFNMNDWKELGKLNSYPEGFKWSNKIPISKINAPSFRIAFRYNAPDANILTYPWSIKKVEIKNR